MPGVRQSRRVSEVRASKAYFPTTAIVVTDRGRRVAALQPFDPTVAGRPLPNREAAIRKRSKIPVDSAVYQSELREDR